MKSIKEKAEENCIKYGNLGNVAYQEFEAGANYVIEQIEKRLDEFSNFEDSLIVRRVIKQLKGK